MKILYGVQATGNGHISRARAMAPLLNNAGFKVDYLFSGRDKNKFFDMAGFGNFRCHKGLTFVTEKGKVHPIKTVIKNNLWTLYTDIKAIKQQITQENYDLILTDFEPITAWAAKLANIPSVALGHQYAFLFPIPQQQGSWFTHKFMKLFAPANICLGLHWHHFDSPILPPIININHSHSIDNHGHVLVYLPFEDPNDIIELLKPFNSYRFICFSPEISQKQKHGHIQLHPPGLESFQKTLASCDSVICNAGFGLASESLQLGKKLLVKPLQGQIEQLSNAIALTRLGLGDSMNNLDSNIISAWLKKSSSAKDNIEYPNVAEAIVEWIKMGNFTNINTLIDQLWQQTQFGKPNL